MNHSMTHHSIDHDRVSKYKPTVSNAASDMSDAQTAHDKLNLMIVRGQDTSGFIDGFNSSPFNERKLGGGSGASEKQS